MGSSETDELLLEIGRVAKNWSIIEVISRTLLFTLCDEISSEDFTRLTAGMALHGTWDAITLYLQDDPAHADLLAQFRQFRQFRSEAQRMEPLRNDAIHAFWVSSPEPDSPLGAVDLHSRKAHLAPLLRCQGAQTGRFRPGRRSLSIHTPETFVGHIAGFRLFS